MGERMITEAMLEAVREPAVDDVIRALRVFDAMRYSGEADALREVLRIDRKRVMVRVLAAHEEFARGARSTLVCPECESDMVQTGGDTHACQACETTALTPIPNRPQEPRP